MHILIAMYAVSVYLYYNYFHFVIFALLDY